MDAHTHWPLHVFWIAVATSRKNALPVRAVAVHAHAVNTARAVIDFVLGLTRSGIRVGVRIRWTFGSVNFQQPIIMNLQSEWMDE